MIFPQRTYDSHNRLIEMIYPDEEKVTYSYNRGGLLEKIRCEKSYSYDYITKLSYDKFELRSYLKYCNGAETFYTYDNHRRLSNLAVNSGGTSIMGNTAAQRWLFGGKELDRISGLDLYDFEARAYDPALARFTSHDAFEEKYYPLSPYLYCAANPLRLIDPDGNIVYVFGNGSDKVVAELQKAVGNSITITKNDNGQLTYERNTEGKLKGYAKRFAEAVEDANITVNLNCRGERTSTGLRLIGGAFMGNQVSNNEDGSVSVVANQELNPEALEKMSDSHEDPGKDTLHELTEAYEGAKISMKNKKSSPMPGVKGSVYNKAHDRAVKMSGDFFERFYDRNGNTLYSNGREDPPGAVKVEYFLYDLSNNEFIFQTYFLGQP